MQRFPWEERILLGLRFVPIIMFGVSRRNLDQKCSVSELLNNQLVGWLSFVWLSLSLSAERCSITLKILDDPDNIRTCGGCWSKSVRPVEGNASRSLAQETLKKAKRCQSCGNAWVSIVWENTFDVKVIVKVDCLSIELSKTCVQRYQRDDRFSEKEASSPTLVYLKYQFVPTLGSENVCERTESFAESFLFTPQPWCYLRQRPKSKCVATDKIDSRYIESLIKHINHK